MNGQEKKAVHHLGGRYGWMGGWIDVRGQQGKRQQQDRGETSVNRTGYRRSRRRTGRSVPLRSSQIGRQTGNRHKETARVGVPGKWEIHGGNGSVTRTDPVLFEIHRLIHPATSRPGYRIHRSARGGNVEMKKPKPTDGMGWERGWERGWGWGWPCGRVAGGPTGRESKG